MPDQTDSLRDRIESLAAQANNADIAGEHEYAAELDAKRDELEHRLTIKSIEAEQSSPVPVVTPRVEDLATAMKKLLPPALLQEVLGYLDPLGAFLAALKPDDTGAASQGDAK